MTLRHISVLALSVAWPAAVFAEEIDDPIVVTASRSGDATPVDRLAASATVLDAPALESRQTRIVSDILRDVPGLAVSRIGAIGGLTQVRIRGSEANHVLVLIDGIEVSDPFQGEFDFGTLIADDSARIEVLRGQQSALYGSDAIGGVIHYITASGAEKKGFSGRVEGGSFGTAAAAARLGGAGDSVDYALTTSFFRTDGTPTARNGVRDIGSDTLSASAKLNWQATNNLKFNAVTRYSRTSADTNDSVFDPTSPLFGFFADSPGVGTKNEAFYGLVRGQLDLLDGRWTTALSTQFADTTRNGFDASGRSSGDQGRRLKGSFESALRFGPAEIGHRITLAIDAEREEFRNTSPPSPFVFTGQRSAENLGLVGEYALTIGETLEVGASLRHDDNNRFANATTYRVQAATACRAAPEFAPRRDRASRIRSFSNSTASRTAATSATQTCARKSPKDGKSGPNRRSATARRSA